MTDDGNAMCDDASKQVSEWHTRLLHLVSFSAEQACDSYEPGCFCEHEDYNKHSVTRSIHGPRPRGNSRLCLWHPHLDVYIRCHVCSNTCSVYAQAWGRWTQGSRRLKSAGVTVCMYGMGTYEYARHRIGLAIPVSHDRSHGSVW